MTIISKPVDLSTIWCSGGDIIKPTDNKIQSGWQVEVPPRQWFNWIDNRQDKAIGHINQYGICLWDGNTQYQGGMSLTMGSDGKVYKAKVTNTAQNPVTDTFNIYWEVAIGASTDSSDNYTTLPGGVIMQWGETTGTDENGFETVVFPKPLQVGVLSFTATHFGLDPAPTAEIIADRTLTSTRIRITDVDGAPVSGRRASYIILGK